MDMRRPAASRGAVPGQAMHPFFDRLKERARAACRRIVFPEGDDRRVIAAAHLLKEQGLANPILVSESTVLGLETVYPASSPKLRDYTELYHKRRVSKGVTALEAGLIARK